MAFGANLIENEVRKALGMPLAEIKTHPIEGHWCEMIIHARPGQRGVFYCLDVREEVMSKNVRCIDMSAKKGRCCSSLHWCEYVPWRYVLTVRFA